MSHTKTLRHHVYYEPTQAGRVLLIHVAGHQASLPDHKYLSAPFSYPILLSAAQGRSIHVRQHLDPARKEFSMRRSIHNLTTALNVARERAVISELGRFLRRVLCFDVDRL
ncbi:hypothetical protein EVAR_14889_1 [Eumeta japonica]|uniref:Uncharacterized protein n=1 Tax=Eumeta variegata TaxID=151549 RepID=A0A4C1V320_EUMVA|nr:hypothetical protein EVAR_14889_1 [Eumeta japonica]